MNKDNSFLDQKVTVKAILLYILPLLLALLLGYLHVRTLNRSSEIQKEGNEQKMAAFEGEIYKLKQAIAQRDAKLKYLLNENYTRLLAKSNTSEGFIWLYHDLKDESWYAEMSNAKNLNEELNFKLFVDNIYVGKIERISDSVGLQRIGTAPMGKVAIYAGLRGKDEPQELIYESAPSD